MPQYEDSNDTEVEATIFGIQSRERGELVAHGSGTKVSILQESPSDNPNAKGTNFDVLDGRDVAPNATDDQNIVIFAANGMSISADPYDPTKPITMEPQLLIEDPKAKYRGWEVVYDGDWVWIRSVGHPDYWMKENGNQLSLVRTADRKKNNSTFWLRTVDAKVAMRERKVEVVTRTIEVVQPKPARITGRGLFPAHDPQRLPSGISGKPCALFEGGYAYKVLEPMGDGNQRIHIYNQTHDKYLKTEWAFGPLSELTALDGVPDGIDGSDGYLKYYATCGPGEHVSVVEGYTNGYRCRAMLDREVDVSSSDEDNGRVRAGVQLKGHQH